MNKEEAIKYLLSKESRQYRRSFYDAFLKKVNFNFNKKAIHITGTNGKGSVATYLNNIFVENGYKCGCFKSPQLIEINEMILLNNEPVSDETLQHYVNKYYEDFEKFQLTQFEMMTFIALNFFIDNNVDIAIIEVGMGGLIDATNVFVPILSIITSIGMDHVQYLGHNIEEIAKQKAGIIKQNTPVLLGFTDFEAENVIKNECLQKSAELYFAPKPTNIYADEKGVRFLYNDKNIISLEKQHALYESYNVSIVLKALEILKPMFPVDKEKTMMAIGNTYQPARFSIVRKTPTVIIDGAHNPSAAKYLVKSIKLFTNKKVKLIFASFVDKNFKEQLNSYQDISSSIFLTTFPNSRAMGKNDFVNLAYPFFGKHDELIRSTIKSANADDVILITGSLAFAGLVYNEFVEGEYND